MPIGRSKGRLTLGIALCTVVMVGAGCRSVRPPERQLPSPDPTSTVLASPQPLTSAQLASEEVYYVVTLNGIVGSDGMNAGTERFTITNNDVRGHEVQFVRLEAGRDGDDIRAAVRSGDWPPRWATVLHATGVMDQSQTDEVRVDPLRVGSYALVDMEVRDGQVLAMDPAYVKLIGVVEAPR